jgi:hypothetical protein
MGRLLDVAFENHRVDVAEVLYVLIGKYYVISRRAMFQSNFYERGSMQMARFVETAVKDETIAYGGDDSKFRDRMDYLLSGVHVHAPVTKEFRGWMASYVKKEGT